MEEIKQIGLNIWGLRGGYKSFCHSDNLNVNAPEILRTWLDIRDILYVSDLTVRFYALEFTSQYKVFTLYRPENDTGGRSGAYVATTLYVPHGVKINRTLDLMRQISDAYHNDHYDAFGNPNTNPDYIQVYLELIKNYAGNIVKEHDLRIWESSAQNNAPKIMPFTNISTVEQFFDKPYRKEFLNYQEVMFWDVDCLQNQQSHGVTFLKREILSTLLETDGSNIAPQFEGGAIKNVPSGCTIERFEREGVDITQNWQSCFFYDKTNVAITLKKPFHHPSLYQGSIIGIGSPFVKRGDDYDFGSRLDFQPRHYEIPVNVANVGNNSFDLYFGSQRVNISSGRGIFAFDGTQANGTCKVSIRPDGMTDFKVGDLIMNKFFASGSDETDPLQSYSIDSLKAFKFSFNQDCTGKLKLKYSSCNIDFSTSNKAYGIVLPAEKKAVDFQFEIDGYNAEIKTADNTTFEVTLTKQSFFVEVVVHQAIRPFVPSNSIQVKVGGKTYKGYRVTVPFADKNSNISLGIDLDGKGHFSNCECNISPNGDDVTLIPRLALLHNGLNQTLRQTLGNVTFEIPSNSTVAVPDNYEVNLHDNDDKYKVETEVESSGIKRTTISLKSMPVSETVNMGFGNNNSNDSNSNANSSYQSSYQPQSGKKTNKVIVGKYSYMGKVFTLDTDSKNYKNLGEGRYSVTIDERPCILCFVNSRPVPEMQEKHAAVNKKNGGFKVVYMDGQYYVESISHKRTGGNGGHGNNDKRKWFLWGGIGLGALLLIGGIVWLVLALSGSERLLKIKDVQNYTFKVDDYTAVPSGKKFFEAGVSTYCLDKKCKQVIVHCYDKNQEELFTDTIPINKSEFKKENNKIVIKRDYNEKVKTSVLNRQKERERKVVEDREWIRNHFKQSLDSVWSLNCSLNWLDSLMKWNDVINESVVKGNLDKNNPNYYWKQDIVSSVTDKDRTIDTGDDWVKNLISYQKQFFNSLKECNGFDGFKEKRGTKRRVGFMNYKSFFTDEQTYIINDIDDDHDFSKVKALIRNGDSQTIDSSSWLKLNYNQIKQALKNN